MFIGDLKKVIQDQPNSRQVILSSDSEGNNYSPLAQISEETYAADSTWSGELEEAGDINALVLWPTN
jgi:hypothetical protein